MRFDFDGLRGKLFLGLLEPLLQLRVGRDHLIHRGENGPLGADGFAIDAGQVGRDRLHLGGVVADVAGHVLGQIGDAAGGHGGPLGGAFWIFAGFAGWLFGRRRRHRLCHFCAEEPHARGETDAQRDAGAEQVYHQKRADGGG